MNPDVKELWFHRLLLSHRRLHVFSQHAAGFAASLRSISSCFCHHMYVLNMEEINVFCILSETASSQLLQKPT